MRQVAILLSLILPAVGCQEPSAPKYSAPDHAVVPVSSRLQVAAANGDVAELPSVKVRRTRDGAGLAGRKVVFTLDDRLGKTTSVEVVTNSSGIATLPAWRTGSHAAVYLASAGTDQSGIVLFRAVVPGAIVDIYDLKSTVPQTVIGEAHYVLYEGGVYNAFYGSPLQAFSIEEGVFGMYVKSSPRIDFLREFSSLASPPRGRSSARKPIRTTSRSMA